MKTAMAQKKNFMSTASMIPPLRGSMGVFAMPQKFSNFITRESDTPLPPSRGELSEQGAIPPLRGARGVFSTPRKFSNFITRVSDTSLRYSRGELYSACTITMLCFLLLAQSLFAQQPQLASSVIDTLATEHEVVSVNDRRRVAPCAIATSVVANNSSTTTSGLRLKNVPLYGVYEILFSGAASAEQTYRNAASVKVTFTGATGEAMGKTRTVYAFWDGKQNYRARFMPEAFGDWCWLSSSNDYNLDGYAGGLRCVERLPSEHVSYNGHLVTSQKFPYTFAHTEGTPFLLLGDTQWSLASEALTWPTEFQTYVAARAQQGFNYVQGRAFSITPSGNERNEGGPAFFANNVDSLNPAYWQALEQRIAYLNSKGLVVGLALGWPGETWPLFITSKQIERYLAHMVNRYAAYNVVWITSGEYEKGAPITGHAFIGQWLKANDPYQHVITTHTLDTSADDFGGANWQTAIHQQSTNLALITSDRRFNKPVLNSGFGFEGKQTADELRKDIWQIMLRGGFFVYGNTLTSNYDAVLTPENLSSKGASYVTYLNDFWTNNGKYQIAWSRFTQFEDLGNARWLAGTPGVEYVVYSEPREAFQITLNEGKSKLEGDWFETRAGRWRTKISGITTAPITLSPPNGGCVAYFTVKKDSTPPVISNLKISNITANEATISWSTNEIATSEIQYGVNNTLQKTLRDTNYVTTHQFTLSNLTPKTKYRVRVKGRDVLGNLSVGRDTSFTTGPEVFSVFDDFNRSQIGSNWTFDGAYWHIEDNELDVTANAQGGWRYLAVYNKLRNDNSTQIIELSYRWGKRADAGGVREGAAALMLDGNNTSASGYWLWHRYGHVWLWAINNGSYEGAKDLDRRPGLSDPKAGDLITIKIRQEPNGNFFDYYINGKFAATAVDSTKLFPKSNVWYTGFFRYGQEIFNQTDDFELKYIKPSGNENANEPGPNEHATGVAQHAATTLPQAFALSSYPNPLFAHAPSMRVRFELPERAEVSLHMLDLSGRVVRTLAEGEHAAGVHQQNWQALDTHKNRIARGTYFLRMRYRSANAASWSQMVRKVLVLP